MSHKLKLAVLALALALAPAMQAGPVTTTFSGNFVFDNDVVLFQVILPFQQILSVYTTSGATGGFAPYLVLFDGTGSPIAQFNGGEPTCSDGFSVPRPGLGCNDTFVQENLAAGLYFVGLAQTNNFATGNLTDPFTEDGIDNRNYTNSPLIGSPCGGGTVLFCDSFLNTPDTSDWTVHFTADNGDSNGSETVTVVPEPLSAAGCMGGLALLSLLARRRRVRARALSILEG